MIFKKATTLFLLPILIFCIATVISCELGGENDNGSLFAPNGLEYKINKDRLTCTIVGLGSCSDTVVTVPEKIKRYRVTAIGKGAFSEENYPECINITEFILPDSLLTIEADAFYRCGGLTELVIPDSVRSIGAGAFRNCYSLRKLTLPKDLTEISALMCYACLALVEVNIPKDVKVIKGDAFMECRLKTINLSTSVEHIETFAFLTYEKIDQKVCYDGTLEQWKAVVRDDLWISDADCITFECQDFDGLVKDVYK